MAHPTHTHVHPPVTAPNIPVPVARRHPVIQRQAHLQRLVVAGRKKVGHANKPLCKRRTLVHDPHVHLRRQQAHRLRQARTRAGGRPLGGCRSWRDPGPVATTAAAAHRAPRRRRRLPRRRVVRAVRVVRVVGVVVLGRLGRSTLLLAARVVPRLGPPRALRVDGWRTRHAAAAATGLVGHPPPRQTDVAAVADLAGGAELGRIHAPPRRIARVNVGRERHDGHVANVGGNVKGRVQVNLLHLWSRGGRVRWGVRVGCQAVVAQNRVKTQSVAPPNRQERVYTARRRVGACADHTTPLHRASGLSVAPTHVAEDTVKQSHPADAHHVANGLPRRRRAAREAVGGSEDGAVGEHCAATIKAGASWKEQLDHTASNTPATGSRGGQWSRPHKREEQGVMQHVHSNR